MKLKLKKKQPGAEMNASSMLWK